MSILIKGMEMPLSCGYCQLKQFTLGIGDDCLVGAKETEYQKRPADCPLVPVPPHGRLIDADGMIGKLIENGKRVFGSGDIPECSSLSIVRDYVESAPTVIEAEEGET